MATIVVNISKDDHDVFIGRPSVFGNPYKIGEDGSREEVIEKFRKYWYAPEQSKLRKKAKLELTGKRLGCYCSPKACHGDIIAEFLNTQDLTDFME